MGGGEVKRRRRTLLDSQHPPREDWSDRPRRAPDGLGRDTTGVQAVRGHVGAVEPPAQFGREQYVAQLGNRVLPHAGKAFGARTQGFEIDPARLEVRVAGDGHHPRLAALGQQREQRVRQREMTQVIDPELQLEAVDSDAALAADAGVVYQDVQWLAEREEVARALANAG